MSYTPTNWKSGDVVTSAKLNKLEQGVVDAGGGGALVVNVTIDPETGIATLDKTWQEIYDSMPFVARSVSQGEITNLVITAIYELNGVYKVNCSSDGTEPIIFETNSASGYPSAQSD